jgi:hypothetical protein
MHMKDRAFSPGIAFISSVIFSRVFFFLRILKSVPDFLVINKLAMF